MAPGSFRFERFLLTPGDRQLTRDGVPVELNARYLDALALLVNQRGRLVTKDRFLEEVWRGVPVTDEALTQCIRTLRKQLGDSAASPRFIETVPKHGYRFIAAAEQVERDAVKRPQGPIRSNWEHRLSADWQEFLLRGGAGTIGGGIAGLLGGLLYGFAGASQPPGPGIGAASVLLVILCITMGIASIGAAGVGFGIAAARFATGDSWHWSVLGGACGGLVVGAVVKLLGFDAFNLLFGQTPGDITGAAEGALLGGAVGLGGWLASRSPISPSFLRSILAAGLVGGAGGIVITLLGGRLMGGSLDLLARRFPESRLRLDQIGGLFGENGFGPVSQVVTGGIEGVLFAGCMAGAMILAGRMPTGSGPHPGNPSRPVP